MECYPFAIHPDNDVVWLDPGFFCRASRRNRADIDAGRNKTDGRFVASADGYDGNAELRARHPAVLDDAVYDRLNNVRRNGHRNALDGGHVVLPVRAEFERRNANQFAARIKQTAAAVSRIDRRVGLQHFDDG